MDYLVVMEVNFVFGWVYVDVYYCWIDFEEQYEGWMLVVVQYVVISLVYCVGDQFVVYYVFVYIEVLQVWLVVGEGW